jgi:hypothetical protein
MIQGSVEVVSTVGKDKCADVNEAKSEMEKQG